MRLNNKIWKKTLVALLLWIMIIGQAAGRVDIRAAENHDPSTSGYMTQSEDRAVSEDTAESKDPAVSEDLLLEDNNETTQISDPESSDEIISENSAVSDNETEPAGTDTVSSGSCGALGDNIIWTVTGNRGAYTLSFNGTGEMRDYIADKGDEAPPWLEKYGSGITSVTFSGNITTLGSRACLNFKNLKTITLPDSLTGIGPYAFEGCTSLSELSIGKNLADIGYGAIRSCTGLEVIKVDPDNAVYSDGNGKNVLITKSDMVLIKGSNKGTVPAGVTKIGDEAFQWCAGLSECALPDSVTEIGESAFSYCTSLTEINLPNSVTALEFHSFYACAKLSNVTFSNNLTAIPYGCFTNCIRLRSVEIPSSVTELGEYAFQGCSALENVTLPGSITEIPVGLFNECRNLKRIKIPENVREIGSAAFTGCGSMAIGLPKSLVSIGPSVFGMKDNENRPVSIVYYAGSESDWSKVSVDEGNEALKNATFFFNSTMPDRIAASSVSVDEAEYTLETGGFACLRADIHPRYAGDGSFSWSSSNLGVASVDQSGKVTALSPGTADITVTETGGKKDVCHLKVVDSADDRSLTSGNNTDLIQRRSTLCGIPIRSYMFRQGSDYCTLKYQNKYYGGMAWEGIIFSRYDENKKLLYKREIPMELPIWGGFYAADDAYYIVTGQNNPEESSEVESFRVTKYDLDWNRLGSAPLFDCNTCRPFDAGSLRMAKKGDYIIVRTCHEQYLTVDGYRHQTNVTFLYDAKNMEICDDQMDVSASNMGYVSHSFNQFVEIDPDGVVMLDKGDAYPRALMISKAYCDISEGYLPKGGTAEINLMEFPGGIEVNATGAAVNGFEIGKNRYIAAGCSVVQDEKNTTRNTYNIFVSTADRELRSSNLHWLTSIAEGEPSYLPPQLAKISDDRFLLLWDRYNKNWYLDGFIYYAEVNANGEQVTPIYRHKGELSDCVPITEDGKVQWFVCKDTKVDFYGISTADITKFSINGTESDSVIDKPGKEEDSAEVTGVTLNIHNAALYPKETLNLSAVVSPADAANKAVTFDSSDPAVATVDLSGKVTAVSEGNAVITVTTVSGGKKDKMTLRVLPSEVAHEDEDNNSPERTAGALWVSGLKESYYYTGYAIKPEIRVYRGERRLREKADYTISFKNNLKVTPDGAPESKKARIIISLKGNYGGTKNFYYSIVPMPLSALNPDAVYAKYAEGKRNDNIRPHLTYNGQNVRYDAKDLELGYYSGDSKSSCIEKGDYTIRITAGGSGNFTGETAAKLTVCEMTPMRTVKAVNLKKSYAYTGQPVEPEIELKNGDEVLEKETDYTVRYEDNTDIGKAVMTVSGCGAYIGEKRISFKISGKYTLSSDDVSFVYDEGRSYFAYGGAKPEVSVTFRGKKLRKGIDYQVTYAGNKKVAERLGEDPPRAVIKGKGMYKTRDKTGIIKPFTIVPADISDLVLVIADRAYSKKANDYKKTAVNFFNNNYVNQKLKRGKAFDYTASFTVSGGSSTPKTGEKVSVSINAGGSGNYTGSTKGSFRISDPERDITKAAVRINKGKACAYTGNGIEPGKSGEPELLLTMKKGGKKVTLTAGTDYEILGYFNNVNKGKGVVLLRGKGAYQGVRAARFAIRASKWGEINKGVTYNTTETASYVPSSDHR